MTVSLLLLALSLPSWSGGAACINTTDLARVIYVSLEHRRDRDSYMSKNLARLAREVPFERFPGQIVSAEEAAALLPHWMAAAFTRERLIGTAGCLKSKLLVLKSYLAGWRASGRDDELLLLLEDDYLIKSPKSLRQLLSAHLTEALRSGSMACRPQLMRLDCWADDDPSSPLPMCNTGVVVGKCKCGGTHAMLIPVRARVCTCARVRAARDVFSAPPPCADVGDGRPDPAVRVADG